MKTFTKKKLDSDSLQMVNVNGVLRNCVALVAWSPLFRGKLIQAQARRVLKVVTTKEA